MKIFWKILSVSLCIVLAPIIILGFGFYLWITTLYETIID